MRSLGLATILALAAAPAFAFCPSLPDDVSTHFVQNQQALMLCQQQELAELAASKAREAKVQADLQALQIEIEQQLRAQQPLLNVPAL
ncbi:MAG TPA: hypothetical protein VG757_04060 [Devosia sp.]|nr:hypothetical protein [Devosia sp.]